MLVLYVSWLKVEFLGIWLFVLIVVWIELFLFFDYIYFIVYGDYSVNFVFCVVLGLF